MKKQSHFRLPVCDASIAKMCKVLLSFIISSLLRFARQLISSKNLFGNRNTRGIAHNDFQQPCPLFQTFRKIKILPRRRSAVRRFSNLSSFKTTKFTTSCCWHHPKDNDAFSNSSNFLLHVHQNCIQACKFERIAVWVTGRQRNLTTCCQIYDSSLYTLKNFGPSCAANF